MCDLRDRLVYDILKIDFNDLEFILLWKLGKYNRVYLIIDVNYSLLGIECFLRFL